jgi:hypothetical protein
MAGVRVGDGSGIALTPCAHPQIADRRLGNNATTAIDTAVGMTRRSGCLTHSTPPPTHCVKGSAAGCAIQVERAGQADDHLVAHLNCRQADQRQMCCKGTDTRVASSSQLQFAERRCRCLLRSLRAAPGKTFTLMSSIKSISYRSDRALMRLTAATTKQRQRSALNY